MNNDIVTTLRHLCPDSMAHYELRFLPRVCVRKNTQQIGVFLSGYAGAYAHVENRNGENI